MVGKLREGKRVSGDATETGGALQATRVLRLSSKAKESHRLKEHEQMNPSLGPSLPTTRHKQLAGVS